MYSFDVSHARLILFLYYKKYERRLLEPASFHFKSRNFLKYIRQIYHFCEIITSNGDQYLMFIIFLFSNII